MNTYDRVWADATVAPITDDDKNQWLEYHPDITRVFRRTATFYRPGYLQGDVLIVFRTKNNFM